MMDSTSRALPTGGCNFCDLTQGTSLTCGCQRFWRRKQKRGSKVAVDGGDGKFISKGSIRRKEISQIDSISEEQDGSLRSSFIDNDDDSDDEDCRCGHHACYHSFESPVSTRTQSTGRRYSLQISDTETSLQLNRSATNLPASGFSITSGTTTERDYSTTTEPSPSIAAARYLKHSHKYQHSNLGANSSTSKSNSQATGRGEGFGDILHSLQETLKSTLENIFSQQSQQAPTGSIVLRNSTEAVEFDTKLTELIKRIEEIQQCIQSHHERLETVETFGSAIEEMRDKVELGEDRANEVEEKVFSFENRLDDRLAPIESRLKPHKEKRKTREEREMDDEGLLRAQKRRKGGLEKECKTLLEGSSQQDIKAIVTSSFATTTSTSTSFSSIPTSGDRESRGTSRLVSVMERLESRLAKIEKNAAPTPETPWTIEVVLLPPAPLKGIWTDGTGSAGGYESSNPQSVSTFSGACSGRRQSHDYDDGPLPRSFGVNSRIYRRLSTRGFVKHIHVLGPTAQDVATAIELDFHGLLDWCYSSYPCDDSTSPQAISTHNPRVGLRWQPLRKVHKQTSLEYLKPGEMMEIMWTVEFLKGSCIMKGRRAVLYITPLLSIHPASISPDSGISWMDIKALPEYKAIGEVCEDIKSSAQLQSNLQLDIESAEECWSWKEALDGVLKAQTASPSARSGSPGSWSSFGPFQLEDEARLSSIAQRTFNEEEPQKGVTPLETIAGSGLGDHHSPGPPSPPISLSNRKCKLPSPLEDGGSRIREERTQRRLRRQRKESPGFALEEVAVGIEGLTPALTTTRSSSYPPSSIAASGRASIARQGSGLSGLSVFSGFSIGGDWELSPRMLGWFTERPIKEGVVEGESEDLGQGNLSEDEDVTGDDTVEDTVEYDVPDDGDGGYASMRADRR